LENGGQRLEARLYKKYKMELLDLLKQRLIETFLTEFEEGGTLDAILEDVAHKKLDPYTACEYILERRLRH
jgi:LAO/AO transport system kinase